MIVNYSYEISSNSWFGYMNCNFSVAGYYGAAKAGLVPEITLLKKDGYDDIEKNLGFQTCVDHWFLFWSRSHSSFVENCERNYILDEATALNTRTIVDENAVTRLYEELWNTHSLIVKTSVLHAKIYEINLDEIEKKFALGWCHMVELLASMSWTLLSLDALMVHGAGFLPSRILTDDSYGWMKQSRFEEYDTVETIIQLYNSPESIPYICAFWRRLVYFEQERKAIPYILRLLSSRGNVLTKIQLISKSMFLVLLPHSNFELVVWSSIVLIPLYLIWIRLN